MEQAEDTSPPPSVGHHGASSQNSEDWRATGTLTDVCFKGDLAQAKQLLEDGADINNQDYDGRTPLHLASAEGFPELAQFLIESKADLNMVDRWGNSPTDEALRFRHPKTADILTSAGGRSRTMRAMNICQVIHDRDFPMLKELVKSGIDVNQGDYDLRTPLHLAAVGGHVDMVSLLLEYKANVNVTDRWGNSPLDEALRGRHSHVLSLLKQAGGRSQTIFNILQVVHDKDFDLLQQLGESGVDLEQCDYDLRTPLHLASTEGYLEAVCYLLQLGVNVNASDRWGHTPLDEAVAGGHVAVIDELLKFGGQRCQKISRSRSLSLQSYSKRSQVAPLSSGPPSRSSSEGSTVVSARGCTMGILEAARKGNMEAVTYIIKDVPDAVNFMGYDRRTPLHMAASTGKLETVEFLIMNKADVNLEDRWGNTPLYEAKRERCWNVVAYLESAANANMSPWQAAAQNDVVKMEELLQRGISVNVQDDNLRAPLHHAATEGNVKICQLLLECGAHPLLLDKDGRTPYAEALLCKEPRLAELMRSAAAAADRNGLAVEGAHILTTAILNKDANRVATLLANGLDPNTRDTEARPSLLNAARSGSVDIAVLLISRNADVNATGKGGQTAMDEARLHGSTEVLNYLQQLVGTPLARQSSSGRLTLNRKPASDGSSRDTGSSRTQSPCDLTAHESPLSGLVGCRGGSKSESDRSPSPFSGPTAFPAYMPTAKTADSVRSTSPTSGIGPVYAGWKSRSPAGKNTGSPVPDQNPRNLTPSGLEQRWGSIPEESGFMPPFTPNNNMRFPEGQTSSNDYVAPNPSQRYPASGAEARTNRSTSSNEHLMGYKMETRTTSANQANAFAGSPRDQARSAVVISPTKEPDSELLRDHSASSASISNTKQPMTRRCHSEGHAKLQLDKQQVLEGYLKKLTTVGFVKVWQKKYFKLEGRKLSFSNTAEDKVSKFIDLKDFQSLALNTNKKNSLILRHKDGKTTMIIGCETQDDLFKWWTALNVVVNAKPAKEGARGKESNLQVSDVQVTDFQKIAVVARGNCGKVLKVRNAKDGKTFGMKIMRKEFVVHNQLQQPIMAEKNILEAIRHPFIIKLHHALQSKTKLYLIMDFHAGGSLAFHLQEWHMFPESMVRLYAAEICHALLHLHGLDIIFRDLKMSNVLLDVEGHVVLTDFGLATAKQEAVTFCGTPQYLAPEVVRHESYAKPVDWWCFGILVYHMLHGTLPFQSDDMEMTFQNIMYKPVQCQGFISLNARALITALTEKNPSERLGGPKVMCAPFFQTINWEKLITRQLRPPHIPVLTDEFRYFSNVKILDPAASWKDEEGEGEVMHFEGYTFHQTQD